MEHASMDSTTQPELGPTTEDNIQTQGPSVEPEDNMQIEKGPSATPTEIEVEEIAENPFDKKKRKRTSKVWEEFKEVTLPDGSKKVECVHCKGRLGLNKTGATTQYNRHLQSCTQCQVYMRGQRQLTISQSVHQSESVSVQTWRWDLAKVREAFAHMLLVHELPFNFAEYEAFNIFMRVSCPNWEKISRATAKKDCESAFQIEKKKIKGMLKNASKVSVTTDLWKSNQNIQYMVVTAHFVDVNMNLQKRSLNFVKVPPPHTGIVVCDALKKCFVEWGIESKVWTITVDNASYNDVCVSNLRSDLGLISKLPLDGKLFHVRCCAHILNILVQYGLTEINDVIHNIRESVKYIGKSVARLHTFGEIANQLKLPHKKLILDCGTRWNATYMMLSNALEFKDVFPRYKQRDEGYMFLPSEEDWKKAAVVSSFLEEFNAVTNIISGSEYPTSNLFLPELVYLKNMLDNALDNSDILLKAMVTKMKEKFDKYWGENNVLLAIASILDPRLKLKVLTFAYEGCSILEKMKYEEEVNDCLHALFHEYVEMYKAKTAETESQACDTNPIAPNVRASRAPLRKGQGRGFSMISKQLRTVENIQSTKSELDDYLEDGVVFHNEEVDLPFDTLKWWRDNKNKYRILSVMACDILAIPITTVASESAFSAGGRIIDPYRYSLNPETVEFLTCGADWVRAHLGIKKKEKIVPSTMVENEVVEYPLD